MMRRGWYIFALILALLPVSLKADANYMDALTRLGSSARMIGIANIEGFSYFSNSVFENPAALYRVGRHSGTFFTSTLMEEVNYNNLTAAMRLKLGGVLAVGYMGAQISNIPIAESVGVGDNIEFQETGGTFGYDTSMLKVAYQFSQTRHLHFGIAGSFYNQTIGDVAGSGYNVDLGVILDSSPLVLSIAARNIISSLGVVYTDPNKGEHSSDGQQETLALQTIYGVMYQMGEFDLLGQLKTVGNQTTFAKSFAVRYRPNFLPMTNFSLGRKEFAVLDKLKSSITFGMSLNMYDISFDYAYETSEHVQFNGKHYFSIGYYF